MAANLPLGWGQRCQGAKALPFAVGCVVATPQPPSLVSNCPDVQLGLGLVASRVGGILGATTPNSTACAVPPALPHTPGTIPIPAWTPHPCVLPAGLTHSLTHL